MGRIQKKKHHFPMALRMFACKRKKLEINDNRVTEAVYTHYLPD